MNALHLPPNAKRVMEGVLGLSLDKNLPANLINNFSPEQTLCDRRHARTLNAEKISDLLLRYGQNVVFISDVKRQQLIA
jgi:hypothetical protein